MKSVKLVKSDKRKVYQTYSNKFVRLKICSEVQYIINFYTNTVCIHVYSVFEVGIWDTGVEIHLHYITVCVQV